MVPYARRERLHRLARVGRRWRRGWAVKTTVPDPAASGYVVGTSRHIVANNAGFIGQIRQKKRKMPSKIPSFVT
jgi:hypothetical protein